MESQKFRRTGLLRPYRCRSRQVGVPSPLNATPMPAESGGEGGGSLSSGCVAGRQACPYTPAGARLLHQLDSARSFFLAASPLSLSPFARCAPPRTTLSSLLLTMASEVRGSPWLSCPAIQTSACSEVYGCGHVSSIPRAIFARFVGQGGGGRR